MKIIFFEGGNGENPPPPFPLVKRKHTSPDYFKRYVKMGFLDSLKHFISHEHSILFSKASTRLQISSMMPFCEEVFVTSIVLVAMNPKAENSCAVRQATTKIEQADCPEKI